MSNRILVAGATGQVGSYVVKFLKEKKADFAVGVSSPEKAIEGIESLVFSYSDHQSMVKAFQGFRSLFLVSPFVPQMQEWMENAVKVAKEAGIKYIVRSSGGGADPNSEVVMAKIQGEIDKAIADSGIQFTIVRPNTFMQNFSTYQLQSIKEQGAIYQPQGDGKSSFIHVKDVAAVAVEALLNPEKHQGKSYDLTGGEALSNGDVAAIISQATGKEVKYIDITDEVWEKSMLEYQIPQELINQLASLNKITKAGYAAGISPLVKELTGNKPITFKEFAKENAQIWK